MNRRRTLALKAALETVHVLRLDRLLAPLSRGTGIIFTLHHIRPARLDAFQPNRILEITPEFLATLIERIRRRGYEIVHLDEVPARLADPGGGRFAVITLDDGYHDNFRHAYPVFKTLDCPFTVYVATAVPDGRAELWWRVLEMAIASTERLGVMIGEERRIFATAAEEEKYAAYEGLYRWLRMQPEDEQRAFIRDLAQRHGIDMAGLCRREAMSWDEIRLIAEDPLATVGAHTVNHFALARIDLDRARAEMRESVAIIEGATGRTLRHFAYPYGDRGSAGPREFALAAELGFETAVTTRPGTLFAAHLRHLHALPRVSMNGEYQAGRYVEAFLTGAPFLLFNGLRRLNVA